VFALSNPGHVLAGGGIDLVAAGLAGALAVLVLKSRGRRPQSTPARLGVAGATLALAVAAGATGVWAAGAGEHDHNPAAAGDPASHLHGTATAGASGAMGGPEVGEHRHGPNVPEVAAATDEERAKAEALWKASIASAVQWRDPDAAAAAGFRFRERRQAGQERRVRFLHVPNPAWRADGRVLRSGEMMHVWFTDDLATAFARRAPLAAPPAANAG
jgi:hypothetical protein